MDLCVSISPTQSQMQKFKKNFKKSIFSDCNWKKYVKNIFFMGPLWTILFAWLPIFFWPFLLTIIVRSILSVFYCWIVLIFFCKQNKWNEEEKNISWILWTEDDIKITTIKMSFQYVCVFDSFLFHIFIFRFIKSNHSFIRQ